MAHIKEDRRCIENASFEIGNILIVNCVNDSGEINADNIIRIFERYPAAKDNYVKNYTKHFLGDVDIVPCGTNEDGQEIYVANAYGFRNMWTQDNAHPIRFEVLRGAFQHIVDFAKEHDCSVHFARWNSERFGTPWESIEDIIRKEYASQGPIMIMYYNEIEDE